MLEPVLLLVRCGTVLENNPEIVPENMLENRITPDICARNFVQSMTGAAAVAAATSLAPATCSA